MKPILPGDQGSAVEDIQRRLLALGYDVANEGLDSIYGSMTAAAVKQFRASKDLPSGDIVDFDTWAALVDATFELGDRSLYLRVPNFHGNDVTTLQNALNVLGFSVGHADGIFGVHTENALREFQTNVGIDADGIAFDDTFDAIMRLKHVWQNKQPSAHEEVHMGLARTAEVLSQNNIVLSGVDPVARNIIGRIWNIATATTENSNVSICETDQCISDDADIVISFSSEKNGVEEGVPTILMGDNHTLKSRLVTALESSEDSPAKIAILLDGVNHYDGSFTSRAAQSIAIRFIDALCEALS